MVKVIIARPNSEWVTAAVSDVLGPIKFTFSRTFIPGDTKLSHPAQCCKQCNMCVESCPVEAINQETKKIDYSSCIECMCCHELCLHKAVELRKDNRVADILMRLYPSKHR